jgi:hypothetical protein
MMASIAASGMTPTAQTNDLPLGRCVMAGRVPAICRVTGGGRDGRDWPGHDGKIAVEEPVCRQMLQSKFRPAVVMAMRATTNYIKVEATL